MNGSGVQPHHLLEVTVVLFWDAQLHVLVQMTQTPQTQTSWGSLSLLGESGTPNLVNIGVIASIILALVVDFKIATSRNLL